MSISPGVIEQVKMLAKIGPLWIGFIVMLGILLGIVDSPLIGLREALSTIKQSHDKQTTLLQEICRQGAKTELSMSRCNFPDREF